MIKKSIFVFFTAILFFSGLSLLRAQDYYMYVGTYTMAKDGGKGIYLYRFSADSGTVTYQSVIRGVENPSFLVTDKDQSHLYAVSELVAEDQNKGGAVAAFSVNRRTGNLDFLGQALTGSNGPCHLTLDHTGKLLFTANYGGGSITVFPVRSDGSVGTRTDLVRHYGCSINADRQKSPHAHEVVMDPSLNLLYVPDLGLDKVFIYQIRLKTGKLAPWTTPFLEMTPGSGPRHMAFSPDEKSLYVLQEMGSGITVFTISADRKTWTKTQQVSLLPQGTRKAGNTGAELQITRDGKYLYASNRGHNSIALFRIRDTGLLVHAGDYPCGGITPRFFTLDPTENFLLVLNQDSGNIVIFKRKKDGRLQKTNIKVMVPKPVCAVFIPMK